MTTSNDCMTAGEVKMTYLTKKKISEQPQIHTSMNAERVLRDIWEPDTIAYRETMYLLCLNRSNRLVAWYRLSTGGVSGTVADPKLIFQCCLLCNATSFLLGHNHPSGSTAPSPADIELTKKVSEAGRVMEIQLNDHLILTEDKYFSFSDEGIL